MKSRCNIWSLPRLGVFMLCVAASMISTVRAASLEEAAEAYNAGDYPGAVKIYEEVAKEKGTSAALLFNIGNCYLKEGERGQAVASYLKALKLDPSDKEIQNNLEYISAKVADANVADAKGKKVNVSPDEDSFFSGLYVSLMKGVASNTWALWGAVCFVALMGCLAAYIFIPMVVVRKIGFFGGAAMLGGSIVFVTMAVGAARAHNIADEAVVAPYRVQLLSEPEVNGDKSSLPLNRGTILKVLDCERDSLGEPVWYKVRLNSDYAGWCQAGDLIVI